jgi:DNA-binding MarR family transcriptional regulator
MRPNGKSTTEIPDPGEGKRGEQGYLGYLLRQGHGAVRQAIERALDDLAVTQPQFLVMTMINAYPGVSGAEIARLTMLTPQTISLIIANLERDGRLTRSVNPEHGRRLLLQLTEEGKNLLAQCRERAHEVDAQLRTGLSADDEQTIRRWLVEIATRNLASDD